MVDPFQAADVFTKSASKLSSHSDDDDAIVDGDLTAGISGKPFTQEKKKKDRQEADCTADQWQNFLSVVLSESLLPDCSASYGQQKMPLLSGAVQFRWELLHPNPIQKHADKKYHEMNVVEHTHTPFRMPNKLGLVMNVVTHCSILHTH